MTLYHASDSRDNCGFGLISQLDGIQSHQLVTTALDALTRMTHRGAVNVDGKTGDGCGISIQLSPAFFKPIASEMGLGLNGVFGVGQVFLNPDETIAAEQRKTIEAAVKRETLTVLGWREVPTDESVLGNVAKSMLPRIEQIFLKAPAGWRKYDVERRLFVARKRVALQITDPYFYIVSMSTLMIVYKALVMPKNLAIFYKDLADPKMESAIVIFHQRFSTNTTPQWRACQPFRFLAHNGEINTISGNRAWAEARRTKLYSPLVPDMANLGPLVNMSGSDSSSLDNMMEILLAGGMDIFQSLRLLVPPAWKNRSEMDADLKAYYEFNAIHMEPWDGPAGIVMTNGEQVACTLDRNGLRPARYVITKDRVLTVASEVGVWEYKEEDVIEKDRVGPGEMLAADTSTGQIWRSHTIDDMLKTTQPYREWLRENVMHLKTTRRIETQAAQNYIDQDMKTIKTYQKVFNVTQDEIEQMIQVMAESGQEPIMSMGDDTPVAVLSQHPRNLFDFFRQQFAQVTNPAIDPIREKLVMSLETYFGRGFNIFEQTDSSAYRAVISSPILNYGKMQQLRSLDAESYPFDTVSLNYGPGKNLLSAIDELCDSAVKLVQNGCVILHLTDRDIQQDHTPIHPCLAMGALNQRLINEGIRLDVNIIVETGYCRDPHHFAVLIGLGATAIYPYLSLQMISELHSQELLDGDLIEARIKYYAALDKGLLKVLSKMGISTISSYRGARLFEVLGFSEEVMARCFTGMRCSISGISFEQLEQYQKRLCALAWNQISSLLERQGQFKYVHGGEYHAYNPDVVQQLQQALLTGDYHDYQVFADTVNQRPVATIRDLLKLVKSDSPLADTQVEPVAMIQKRFDTAAMSIGALSTEAHESLAQAMNRIGGRSNSGEGGEDSARFGTDRVSKIKQVASGRFGVTAKYLVNAEVLQIKVAQGAKPGEGGQLPGAKVSVEIARLRHAKPGTTLISPPPHHDIYSIEDLAQLIFDLKQINPKAMVSVKLVSGPGVGTIAAGVAKAYADMITIAGHDGGTGASPTTSVKYAGNPWEIGLAEAHQALIENDLRDRVCLQVDGGLKTGLDVIKGSILGADSFGFGTGPMVALGCKYLRICHLNNCATGVATQNSQLREKHFKGLPERVIQYFEFIATEVRHWLSYLGVPSLDELIGRTDLLEQIPGTTAHHKQLDLSKILASAKRPKTRPPHYQGVKNVPYDQGVLNQQLLASLRQKIENANIDIRADVKNYDRSVGASLSSYIASKEIFGKKVNVYLRGIAGQSLGVWNAPGLHISLQGDANDYVGKGMSGGSISIYPQDNIQYVASRGAIIGNTCLYGATGGRLFAAGQAGERFAVRNSGATAVVEGIGDHGCEYMTGGTVMILGPVGENFGAGMTAGCAIVLDSLNDLNKRLNEDCIAVSLDDVEETDMVYVVSKLLSEHIENSNSKWAFKIRHNLDHYVDEFKVVLPRHSDRSELRLFNEDETKSNVR